MGSGQTNRSINDYALIGNSRSAALIRRDGAIDWLCWPRFDSPALFARLLGDDAGHFTLSPSTPFVTQRRYLPHTNVLETHFDSERGQARVVDCMPLRDPSGMSADEELLRCVEGVGGVVEFRLSINPRPDFGRKRVRWKKSWMGMRASVAGRLLLVRASVPLDVVDGEVRATFSVREGERVTVSMTWAEEAPAVLPVLGDEAWRSVDQTARTWRRWVEHCDYRGPWRQEVLRSALALKALIFSPSGAIVAAPTTSLPERVGGSLNWDYRFCWLRDASFVARALLALGHQNEAESFADWMEHATALTHPRVEVLYDVYGRRPPAERTLSHLSGWADSAPVRVGNGARHQLQLDVYGEVVDALARTARARGSLSRNTARFLISLGDAICRHWNKPDESIWEVRSGPAHHTFSRALCWTALDRIISLANRGYIHEAPLRHFRKVRDTIRDNLDTHGYNEALGAWTTTLAQGGVDASLLLLPHYGYTSHVDPRMQATWRAIRDRLSAGPGLLRRYEYEGEGAFTICSFWAVQYLAGGGGSLEEARERFEATMGFANDVGLLSEEVDPATGDALGNFPQAFSHVGLINAAISLERRARLEGGLGDSAFTAPSAHDHRYTLSLDEYREATS